MGTPQAPSGFFNAFSSPFGLLWEPGLLCVLERRDVLRQVLGAKRWAAGGTSEAVTVPPVPCFVEKAQFPKLKVERCLEVVL